jgi:hypothetical protein
MQELIDHAVQIVTVIADIGWRRIIGHSRLTTIAAYFELVSQRLCSPVLFLSFRWLNLYDPPFTGSIQIVVGVPVGRLAISERSNDVDSVNGIAVQYYIHLICPLRFLLLFSGARFGLE